MPTVATMQKKAFFASMDKLRAHYGSIDDGLAWRARVDAFWGALRDFEAGVLIVAFNRAPTADYYPDRFPTSGQLARVCTDVQRERESESGKPRSVGDLTKWDGTTEHLADLCPDADLVEDHELPAGHPATRLAIQWAKEDRDRTLGAPGNTPAPVGRERLQAIGELLDGKFDEEAPF